MSTKDALGDRIKGYEDCYRIKLPEKLPVILRLDGKSFSSYTKSCKRPIDENIVSCMNDTAIYLCKNIQNAVVAYVQSDEISILLNNFRDIKTMSYVNNNLQKMCSVAAGMASAYFTTISDRIFSKQKLAVFDCRGFILPKEEVNNAFIWRQQDATRNSVQMLARSLYSHKELLNKNNAQLQDMIFNKGINWNDCLTSQKRGRCIIKESYIKEMLNHKTQENVLVERSEWVVDNDIPIFSKDTMYINEYVFEDDYNCF